MRKKITLFLIVLYVSNIFSNTAFFYFSPVHAQNVSEEKPQDKTMSKKEAHSTLKKIFETVMLPFAYAFQWAIMKITGPAKVGVNYSIYIDKFRKPSPTHARTFIDDPKKTIKNVKIFLPVILLHEKTKVITAAHFKNHIQNELAHLSEYIKKTPASFYKRGYEKLKRIKVRDVKSKYGEMIEISYLGVTDPAFRFERVSSSRKIKNILPYDLSKEYTLQYEEKLSEMEDYSGKNYYGHDEKTVTVLYVEWEGKGQLKMDFRIGMGARFGWGGGRSGMSYTFCPEQLNKTVTYRRYRSGNYVEQELIFKKPGWYKVCMVKFEQISAL